MTNLLEWKERATYFGGQPAQVKVVAHGLKPEWKLIVKTQEQNSGVVTVLKNMLLSTNFVEVSTLLTSSAGLIVIQSVWRSKAQVDLFVQQRYGSPVI